MIDQAPDLNQVLAEVDRLVQPWLEKHHDDWRHDPEGLPLEDDLYPMLARLRGQRGQPDLDLRVRVCGYGKIGVSEAGVGEEWPGQTLPEALTRMLLADLRRVCVACCSADSHEALCPVLLAEEGISEEEARAQLRREHEQWLGRSARPRLAVVGSEGRQR